MPKPEQISGLWLDLRRAAVFLSKESGSGSRNRGLHPSTNYFFLPCLFNHPILKGGSSTHSSLTENPKTHEENKLA